MADKDQQELMFQDGLILVSDDEYDADFDSTPSGTEDGEIVDDEPSGERMQYVPSEGAQANRPKQSIVNRVDVRRQRDHPRNIRQTRGRPVNIGRTGRNRYVSPLNRTSKGDYGPARYRNGDKYVPLASDQGRYSRNRHAPYNKLRSNDPPRGRISNRLFGCNRRLAGDPRRRSPPERHGFHEPITRWFVEKARCQLRLPVFRLDGVQHGPRSKPIRVDGFNLDNSFCTERQAADLCHRINATLGNLYKTNRGEYFTMLFRQNNYVRRGTLVQVAAYVDQVLTYVQNCGATINKNDVLMQTVPLLRDRIIYLFNLLHYKYLKPLTGVDRLDVMNNLGINQEMASRSPILAMARAVGLLNHGLNRLNEGENLALVEPLQQMLVTYPPGTILKHFLKEVCAIINDRNTVQSIKTALLLELQDNYANGLFFHVN